MTFKEWVKSEEFKKIYKSMPKEIRDVVKDQIPKCGSLGGGNHFWELQKDGNGNIWFMIHSGSRKLGSVIGNYYNEVAKELNQRWYTSVLKNYDLAFLPIGTKEFKEYFTFMNFACTFAKYNHEIMRNKSIEIIKKNFPDCDFIEHYCVTHNYAAFENHFKENVIVHRKGATLARKDMIIIIPGSQGSKSYIVKGLGNPDSFNSCSHGAGRSMSRTQAKQRLDIGYEIAQMNAQGIIHSMKSTDDLDEANGAYKNIDVVMRNQEDLVEILVELRPLAVIKGK